MNRPKKQNVLSWLFLPFHTLYSSLLSQWIWFLFYYLKAIFFEFDWILFSIETHHHLFCRRPSFSLCCSSLYITNTNCLLSLYHWSFILSLIALNPKKTTKSNYINLVLLFHPFFLHPQTIQRWTIKSYFSRSIICRPTNQFIHSRTHSLLPPRHTNTKTPTPQQNIHTTKPNQDATNTAQVKHRQSQNSH